MRNDCRKMQAFNNVQAHISLEVEARNVYFKAVFLIPGPYHPIQPVPSKLGTGVLKSPTQLSLQFMHIQMKCQKLYNQTKFIQTVQDSYLLPFAFARVDHAVQRELEGGGNRFWH